MTNGTVVNALFQAQDSTKLVYQYVFANTDVGNRFKLCTADVPRQDMFLDDKALSQYGITSSVLLIVEMTEERYFSKGEWITEITELDSTVDAVFIERVLRIEKESRTKFMKFVSSCAAVIGPHTIKHITLFEDLLKLYNTNSEIVQKYPLQMDYFGENAVDLGGVSRDVMSAFWQLAYQKLFDGSKLLVPVISPHVDLSLLPTIGKISSHGYLCTGFLPIQISFPSLAAMLLGPNIDVESRVLMDFFLDYVSDVDWRVLHGAVQIAAQTSTSTFPSDVQEQLLTVLGNYGCRQLMSPSNLSQLLANIARFIFLISLMMAYSMIYSGIPSEHQDLWHA
ncbi:PREDICTED: uncharacterized protein LOC109584256 [Amphimedon queenslandica]|uniref:UBX domain-containing protein n=1 Tax=Amphimedon queenslandica TaxID=400682 RepID=A0AAN0JFS9_AMPQE|nr:PREDICTED: uncharacterized protein LOC109584256 [Amphimedon queenslandica]|eukprot:XP_019855498.1 PREDICTED: uncharacterized protein LOC109584256 [Amphimedon queenslandica]